MNRKESIAHFQKIEAVRKAALDEGKSQEDAHEAAKSAWNEWAEELLAEGKTLEENGEWESKIDLSTNLREVGSNDQTKAWFDKADLDFNTLRFALKEEKGNSEAQGVENNSKDKSSDVKSIYSKGELISFSGYIFPAYAYFDSATFSGYADFSSATFIGRAIFASATFSGDAEFSSVTFISEANFISATFSGTADFNSATFSGYANFDSATFNDTAYFDSATFGRHAYFRSATFISEANFSSVTFSSEADFGFATFSGNADFAMAEFKSYANFSEAKCNSQASFHAIDSQVSFNLSHARFRHVPDFLNAKFREEEPPNLE